jgi:hypothetical protein
MRILKVFGLAVLVICFAQRTKAQTTQAKTQIQKLLEVSAAYMSHVNMICKTDECASLADEGTKLVSDET